MQKLMFNLARIYLYIPTIALPVLLYKFTGEFLYSSIALLIWICINYYIIQSDYVTKLFKVCILIGLLGGLIIEQHKIYIIVLVIINSLLGEIVRRILSEYQDKNQGLYILLGMSSVGILCINTTTCIILMFLLFLLFSLNILKAQEKIKHIRSFENNKRNNIKLNKFGILFAIVHNLHYYCFAFLIPIFAYIYGMPLFAGCLVAVNWVLFLEKDKINSFFLKKNSQDTIIVFSFIGLSIIYLILYFYGKNLNIIELTIVLVIQGGISGLAEEFWYLENMNNTYTQNCWKFSGIVGSGLSIALSWYNICWQSYFGLPAVFTGIIGIIYMGVRLWRKK